MLYHVIHGNAVSLATTHPHINTADEVCDAWYRIYMRSAIFSRGSYEQKWFTAAVCSSRPFGLTLQNLCKLVNKYSMYHTAMHLKPLKVFPAAVF